MKIKRYDEFLESIIVDLTIVDSLVDFELNESLSIFHDAILKSIGARELDIMTEFSLPTEDYKDLLNIDFLSKHPEFLNSLASIGLKKSKVENSEDYNTFLSVPCKFMFIYREEANELENPEYVLFQVWDNNKWMTCKLYKIEKDVSNFYTKLSSKVLELEHDNIRYIYNTSNGTEWNLQNISKANDDFKKYLRSEDLELLIKDKKMKITII